MLRTHEQLVNYRRNAIEEEKKLNEEALLRSKYAQEAIAILEEAYEYFKVNYRLTTFEKTIKYSKELFQAILILAAKEPYKFEIYTERVPPFSINGTMKLKILFKDYV